MTEECDECGEHILDCRCKDLCDECGEPFSNCQCEYITELKKINMEKLEYDLEIFKSLARLRFIIYDLNERVEKLENDLEKFYEDFESLNS